MKDLFKITLIEDNLCQIEANIENDDEGELLSATLLGILGRDEGRLKAAILSAVFAYAEIDPEELSKIVMRDMMPIVPSSTAS